jgi:hypothetical protein
MDNIRKHNNCIKISVLCYVTPYRPVDRTNVSEEHVASIVRIEGLMMEAGGSSEIVITVSQTPGRHIPEKTNLHSFRIETFQPRSL